MTSAALIPPSLPGIENRIEHGTNVIRVSSPNELTQIAGWLRFTSVGHTYFRGQAELHATMTPSGMRSRHHPGPLKTAGLETHSRALAKYVDLLMGDECRCEGGPYTFAKAHLCSERVGRKGLPANYLVSGTYRAVVEPLLQHYGIKTRWVDLVDNVWVALWFGCYRERVVGRYAHHSKRSVAREGSDAKAYIAVLDTGELHETSIPGYTLGPETRLVDLRYCVPSVYLRPHAQHGLLLAVAGESKEGPSLTKQVRAYIELDLFDALDWLGDGGMTSAGVLFPSATEDVGYRRLLDCAPTRDEKLGEIKIFGPSA